MVTLPLVLLLAQGPPSGRIYGAQIVDPKPPVPLVKGMKPIEEYRWFAQGGTGSDYTYAFKEAPAILEDRVKQALKDPWKPGPHVYRKGYKYSEPKSWRLKPGSPEMWRSWAVRVAPVKGEPSKTLLIITRSDSFNPPQGNSLTG